MFLGSRELPAEEEAMATDCLERFRLEFGMLMRAVMEASSLNQNLKTSVGKAWLT